MKHLCLLLLTAGWIPLFSQVSELPLTLSMPYDGDTIEEDEPVFVWQADLMAVQTDPRLSQRLTVVQVSENQTPLDAMVLNAPVLIRENLTGSSFPYSSTDHDIVENIWYAWQVSYLMNGLIIGQSEVWKFIKAAPSVPQRKFIALRRQNDASVYHPGNNELCVSATEKGSLDLRAVVIRPNGRKENVQLREVINDEISEAAVSRSSSETRYFLLDISQFPEEGTFVFEWNGNKKHSYTINFMKE